MGLFTIQNYILLKLFGKPPQSPHTLVCHKKLHTSQIAKLEMRCCLTTIKNYTPLKPVSQSDAQNIRLTTIKNYIPIKRSAKFWLIIISFKPI